MRGRACPSAAGTLEEAQESSPGSTGGKLEPGTIHCQVEDVCWDDVSQQQEENRKYRGPSPSSCLPSLFSTSHR